MTLSTKQSEVSIIESALLFLSARDTDHAQNKNGIGFNGRDTDFGNSLAQQIRLGRTLSQRQMAAALKMLRTYKNQLATAGIELPASVPVVIDGNKPDTSNYPPKRPTEVKLVSDIVYVRVAYDEKLVLKFREIRTASKSRGWDGMYWQFKLICVPDLEAIGIVIPPMIRDRFNALFPDGKPAPAPELPPPARKPDLREMMTRVVTVPPLDPHLLEVSDRIVKEHERVPYEHQTWYIHNSLSVGSRAICALDVGCGKTYAALIDAAVISALNNNAPLWVIAPISLHENWRREAEMLGLKVKMISWAKIPPPPDHSFVLIADESANIQHMRRKKVDDHWVTTPIRTGATLELALSSNCLSFQALTGTPVPNGRPAGLFPSLKACRHWLADNKRAYEVTFCQAGPTRWSAWDNQGVASPKILERLHAMTADVLFRKRKTECLDLPPLSRPPHPITLSPAAAKTYEETFERLRKEWHERVMSGLISSNNEALVVLGQLMHATSAAKVESTIETINNLIFTGNQIIAAFSFKDSLDAVSQKLTHPHGIITGDTPAKQRQPQVDQFQSGELKTVLVTHGAGGVGLNMQNGDYVILHDRPWRPGDVEQVEGRAWRAGVRHPVISLWPQCNSTDRAVDAVLTAKQKNADLIVDGKVSDSMGINVTLCGKSTILPQFDSIGEVAKDILTALFETEKPVLEIGEDYDETEGEDDE